LFGRVATDFAATGGVHQAEDALKLLLAGGNVTMLASALLLNGPDRMRTILEDMSAWLEEHEYTSVGQLRGSMSQMHVAEPASFERAHCSHRRHLFLAGQSAGGPVRTEQQPGGKCPRAAGLSAGYHLRGGWRGLWATPLGGAAGGRSYGCKVLETSRPTEPDRVERRCVERCAGLFATPGGLHLGRPNHPSGVGRGAARSRTLRRTTNPAP
jgi:hypothetical protein